jgi:PadR family transcriptional regulator PadR
MDSWLAQARRGVVELCVLQLIGQRPRYGYQLVTKLAAWEPLAATEGTLYPLLRRLQREGSISAFWEESQDGPPRKYYQLTDAGLRLLESQLAEWQRLTQAVTTLRTETNEDEEVPDGSGSRREPTLSRRAARKPEPAARS